SRAKRTKPSASRTDCAGEAASGISLGWLDHALRKLQERFLDPGAFFGAGFDNRESGGGERVHARFVDFPLWVEISFVQQEQEGGHVGQCVGMACSQIEHMIETRAP